MGRVDYEAAWTELGAEIAEKPSHGRADLLQAMAQIAADNVVEEDLLQTAARLNGRVVIHQKGPEIVPATSGDR